MAQDLLDEAVKAAAAAEAAARGGSVAEIGAAARAAAKANGLLNEQATILENTLGSLAWYRKALVRQAIPRSLVVLPREAANAMIVRTPRTIPTSATDSTPMANPDAVSSSTFEDVMYSAGDTVFSGSGDEFKVNGYVVERSSAPRLRPSEIDSTIHTGFKLTNSGLVIRTGGTDPRDVSALAADADYWFDAPHYSDFTDMRRRITTFANDANYDNSVGPIDGIMGQNGWDLTIAFDEPQTRSVARGHTSWTGNGDFYWRSIVEPDKSQTLEKGDYYAANAFGNQPAGQEDLGTYEVWLSNHLGVADRQLEPAPGRTRAVRCPDGSRGTSCPDDDIHLYLNYAAYGLFVYTPNTETFLDTSATFNGQVGRINTVHFGYSAFATDDGRRTRDISEAISGGKFVGQTLAYEVKGYHVQSIQTRLLRGDVTLTVNIPKGPEQATVQGTMNNFQFWDDQIHQWSTYIYPRNFEVALNLADVSDDGTFEGTARAIRGGRINNSRRGVFKGNFYGPRSDKDDLEVAGSWAIGVTSGSRFFTYRNFYGSFGAKQNPL